MFVEVIQALIQFDLVCFLSLILNNLHWIFAFGAIVFIFSGGKKLFSGIIIITFSLWAMADGANMMGWVFVTGHFLLLLYITKFFILKFAEETPALQKRLIWVNEVSGYGTWILFNFWYLGWL